MRKLLTMLSKIGEVWILFFGYVFLLFMLAFGFRMLWSIWEALIGQYIYVYTNINYKGKYWC